MQNYDGSLFTGTKTQILASVSGTLFAVSDGMSFGWTAPVIPFLISESSHIKTTKYEAEWLESCLMVGSFFGLPFTIYFVDKIGRKKSLLAAAFISLISWIIVLVATKMWHVFVARFIFGVTANTSFVAAPIYVAEIADHKIRGFLSSIIYLNMLMGLVIVYCVGPFLPFYVPPVIGITVLAIELVIFPFTHESPYYLLHKGETENAKKSLNFFRPNRDITTELKDISKAIERQRNEKSKFIDLILVKSNRKAIIIMTVLDAGQHLCAISVILMNLHMILESAGSIYIDSSIAAIIFSVIMLLTASIASTQVDKYGRKALIILSSFMTGFCLLAIAVYFNLKYVGYDVRTVSWIPIVAMMFYAASFKLGVGIVPIVLTAELFSSKMKAFGMTIADLILKEYTTQSILERNIIEPKKEGSYTINAVIKKDYFAESPKKPTAKESWLKQDFVPENDAEACLTALKYENLSAEEFDSHWNACAKYRLSDIKIMPTSAEVFKKWPFYKKPYGYRLIDIDYEIAFGNGELLFNNWEKSFPNIVAFLQKDGHIKDSAAKTLLGKSVKDSCDENGKYASVLWAIHGYLEPSTKFCSKNITGKTIHTKYTITGIIFILC
ncbi:hypothetical protein JTB14_025127 [Gonioctena quinquepunctata]|nr:hypothetical protein JTB14_025127 [Gonioctena quinquepunctata]